MRTKVKTKDLVFGRKSVTTVLVLGVYLEICQVYNASPLMDRFLKGQKGNGHRVTLCPDSTIKYGRGNRNILDNIFFFYHWSHSALHGLRNRWRPSNRRCRRHHATNTNCTKIPRQIIIVRVERTKRLCQGGSRSLMGCQFPDIVSFY